MKQHSNRVIRLLFHKELLDVFRDKKAVVMMILVPVLLYPLIFFGALAVMTRVESGMQENNYLVGLVCDDGGAMQGEIERHNAEKERQAEQETASAVTAVRAEDQLTVADETYDSEESRKNALQQEKIDAFVVTEKGKDGRLVYQIEYLSSVTNSQYASGILQDVLEDLRQREIRQEITDAGLDAEVVMHPIRVEEKNIASTEQSAGSMLGMILPFLLVISLLMGTMYPAIDTMAGEKERGTLETLLTLPVTNRQIIIAKFLTVALVGVISALLNILSIGFMIFYLVRLMGDTLEQYGISLSGIRLQTFLPAILFTALAVIAFSLFISAVTMCITAFARSYKEANNYITPLTLVVMLTGYIGFIPNVDLTRGMALVPVANICLMIKNLLLFKVDYGIIALVLISNIFYAAVAVMLLGKIYDSEAVLFDEGRSGLQLFTRRSNMKKGGVPTPGDAWFVTILVMFVYIFLGSLLQMKYGFGGVFGIQMIILLIPLLYTLYTKRSIRDTYSFHRTSLLSFVAAFFIACGAILIGTIITGCVTVIFPDETSAVSDELTRTLLSDNGWLTFLVVAVTPGICEEMMFRGFLFSGFRSRYRTAVSVLLVAVIFGIYHMSIVRFFTTAFLGGILAAVVYYADSIYPAMMIHMINNGLAVLQMYRPDLIEVAFPLLSEEEPSVLAAAVIGAMGILLTAAGFSIFSILKSRQQREISQESRESREETGEKK